MGAKQKRTLQLLPMDELQYRPCEVDGVPAVFHRWVEEDRALLNVNVHVSAPTRAKLVRMYKSEHIIPDGCNIEVLRETFALVEFLDGSVAKIKPELVRFVNEES